MAFLEDPEEEQTGQPASAPAQISSNMSGPAGAQQTPKGSGSFVNLQKYIEANKPKAQELTQGIQQNITNQAQQTRDDIGKQRDQALGQQSQFVQEEKRLQNAPDFYKSTFQQAGQGNLQEQDINKFRDLATGKQVELVAPDIQQQRASAKSLEQRAKELETSQGRFGELQKLVGGKSSNYSGGQRSLDSLLLAGDRQGRAQAIKNVKKATQGLEGSVDQLQGDIEAKRSALQNLAAQRQQEIQNLLQQGTSPEMEGELGQRGLADIQADLEARRLQTSQETPQQIEALKQRIASNQLTAQDLQSMGLAPGTRIYDLNLADFVSDQAREATLAGVATPEEVRRYQALQKLAGNQGGILTGEEALAQAGTYDPGIYRTDTLQSAIQSRQEEVNSMRDRFKQEYGKMIASELQDRNNSAAAQVRMTPEQLQNMIDYETARSPQEIVEEAMNNPLWKSQLEQGLAPSATHGASMRRAYDFLKEQERLQPNRYVPYSGPGFDE